MSKLCEYIEELNSLCLALEKRGQQSGKLSRNEVAILDVYGTIGHVEGDGLDQFWVGCDDPDRALDSFRIVRASKVADAIEKSRWVIEVLERGTDSEGQYQFTKKEEQRLDKQEDRVYELFIGLPTKLMEFAKRNDIFGE